ncbi:MAG TPA: Gfo/Idh/MocA family oxidoreductase [Streptosporangiaceae bacterium]
MTAAGGGAGAAPVGVAIVGCGTISEEYMGTLTGAPSDVRVVFCADLDVTRAAALAAAHDVPGHGTVAEALANPDVDLVINLTIPAAHAEVCTLAIDAGKHVWSEKPLALEPGAGAALVARAAEAGLRLGCAPDTVLGPGLRNVYALTDAGTIGEPLSALALMQGPGPDLWHPAPEFLFGAGAGPLFDMGPYYLTALSLLFGPVASVAAVGRRARLTRVIRSGPRAGTSFPVDVPTYMSALLTYAGGATATIVLSFDSPARHEPRLEVAGSEATMALPDPNRFDGDARIKRTGEPDWTVIPPDPDGEAGRGIGALDMVRSMRAGVPHRCSGELALHVVDTMTAIARSAESGSFEEVRTSFPSYA